MYDNANYTQYDVPWSSTFRWPLFNHLGLMVSSTLQSVLGLINYSNYHVILAVTTDKVFLEVQDKIPTPPTLAYLTGVNTSGTITKLAGVCKPSCLRRKEVYLKFRIFEGDLDSRIRNLLYFTNQKHYIYLIILVCSHKFARQVRRFYQLRLIFAWTTLFNQLKN